MNPQLWFRIARTASIVHCINRGICVWRTGGMIFGEKEIQGRGEKLSSTSYFTTNIIESGLCDEKLAGNVCFELFWTD